MAKATSKTAIVVTLETPQEKKNVIRYDNTEDKPALRSIYIDKESLRALAASGFFPEKIKVTIEKA